MLSRGQIERLAQTLTQGDAGQAEKLYLQDIILATVSRETVDELVFNGGTALLKCYQLDRFSEDLDFTARGGVDIQDIVGAAIRDLENYGAGVAEREDGQSEDTVTSRLAIEGPLFTGDRRSLSFVRIEANTRATANEVQVLRYTSPFPDIASFDLAVLAETEILAEKVRALMTRRQGRDLYDIYHLLTKGTQFDQALVEGKLAYYDLQYDRPRVLEEARKLERTWHTLETLTFSSLPVFDAVIERLGDALPEGNP